MSSRGQLVIPEKARKQLNLGAGSEFVVVWDGDLVVLKVVRRPTKGEYAELAKKAKDLGATVALTKAIGLAASSARAWKRL
jgi:AbrB family looped-hinge helix DNA binding protein